MKIQRIKNRNFLVTYHIPQGWDLNLHFIIGQKYNYLIDTGLGPLSLEPIMEHIKEDNKKIMVINTHYHWDHIWGNNALSDCNIIAHKLCRELIQSKWEEMLQRNGALCTGEVKMQLPNMVFDNELYFPEDKIRIIYTPGHTIDSISVIDEEDKVLNASDNIGDTLEEIVPTIYSEKSLYRETLLKYKQVDFDICLSGHNIPVGKEVIDTILTKLEV